MSAALRILISGFGPFPGAPFNPTPVLVARLAKLRRPALAAVDLVPHIFKVSYRSVDSQLPGLIEDLRPDAMLMFGLAARTPYLRIETRARNAITTIWPDASGVRVGKRAILGTAEAISFGPLTSHLARAARSTGIDARLSRDAGSYLCNYLCWRALEAQQRSEGPLLSAFIHVPLTAHDGGRLRGIAPRMSLDEMVDAGEAILMQLVAATRRAKLRPD
jgi:pyroglutamyl-peptidase